MIRVDMMKKQIKRRGWILFGWILFWLGNLAVVIHLFVADRYALAGIALGLQNFGFYKVIYAYWMLDAARMLTKSLEESDDEGRKETV